MIPTKLIQSKDFHDAWYKINRTLTNEGAIVPCDEQSSKLTRDMCCTIELTGNAIEQIINRELHEDYHMKSGLDTYVKQFDYDSPEFEKSNEEQEYTYAGRMFIDADIIRSEHLLKPYDRGVQLTTWNKYLDLGNTVRPCFQRMWIRELADDTCELHVTYRSHDTFAWQFNMIALVSYARKYITGDRKIVKIVEFNDSLHIYDYDWERSRNVSKPSVNMRLTYA